jgi:hypothetical protein
MRTHIDNVHPHLLIKRKSILNERVVVKLFEIDHSWQHGKKKVGAIGIASTSFLGSTNPYKNANEAQQRFIEDLVLYMCKSYKPLSTCKNIWLRKLVLHQCPYVVFPFCSSFVK